MMFTKVTLCPLSTYIAIVQYKYTICPSNSMSKSVEAPCYSTCLVCM